MRFFARVCMCTAVVIGVCVGPLGLVHFLWFGGQSDLSLLLFELRRSEALQSRSEAVVGNIVVKHVAIAELVAGRVTLREAAVRFAEANQLVENNEPDLVPCYRMPTTEAGVYQQVLAWMHAEVSSLPPEQAKHILAPLEKEYELKFGPKESAVGSPSSSES